MRERAHRSVPVDSEEESEKKNLDLALHSDDLLRVDPDLVWQQFGTFGRYQMINLLMASAPSSIYCAITMVMIFLAEAPATFSCIVNDGFEKQYQVLNRCTILDLSSGKNRSCIELIGTATRLEYANSSKESSITNEFDLVCERSEWREHASASFLFGRRRAFLLSLTISVVANCAAAVSPHYFVFLALRFVAGFLLGGNVCIGNVMMCEVVAPRMREFMTIVSAVFWVSGYFLAGFSRIHLDNWRWVYFFCTAPGLIMLPLYFKYFQESLQWQVCSGQKEAIARHIQRAMRINKKRIKVSDCLTEPNNEETNDQHSEHNIFILIVRTPALLYFFILLSFIVIVMNLTYWALSLFGSVPLSEHRMTAFFLSGIIEIPSSIIAMVLMKLMNRRPIVSLMFVLTALSMTIAVVAPTFLQGVDTKAAVTMVFPLFAKMFNAVVWSVLPLAISEMTPTVIRNTFSGGVYFCGEAGSVAAPYLESLNRFGANTASTLIAFLAGLCALGVMTIPETKGVHLGSGMDSFDEGPLLRCISRTFQSKSSDSEISMVKLDPSQKDTNDIHAAPERERRTTTSEMGMDCGIMYILSFVLLLLARPVGSFVYSCEQVLFQLMNTEFTQSAKYVTLSLEEGFVNLDQLKKIFLVNDDSRYSFLELSRLRIESSLPWKIVGDNPPMNCHHQFTLILRSELRQTHNCFKQVVLIIPNDASGIYVTPQNGMWLYINTIIGDGNVTIYTGAGSGEEEERYFLQSWPCTSMPDWIWSFDSVFTIEFDLSCSYTIMYKSLVNVDMQLNFDTENRGSLQIQKHYSGNIKDYKNGSQVDEFYSSYFEVRWAPKQLQNYEISNNMDNVYVDIQLSNPNDDGCPDDYTFLSDGIQKWCYNIIWPIYPVTGYYLQEAADICDSTGDYLPILTSDALNNIVAEFAAQHYIYFDYWIGITCDAETNTWMWPDGEVVEYNSFTDGIAPSCTGAENIALNFNDNSWIELSPETEMDAILCARRPQYPTVAPTEAHSTSPDDSSTDTMESIQTTEGDLTISVSSSSDVTTTSKLVTIPTTVTETSSAFPTTTYRPNGSISFPIWAIVFIGIFVCACFIITILIARRRIVSLRARIVEESLDKTIFPNMKQEGRINRYYGPLDNKENWEIERTFVGIDFLHKLGEGAFGSVFLGRVLAKNIPSYIGKSNTAFTGEVKTVAVKMLHQNSDSQKEREFRDEINIMQRIGYHERLVNMIACVTLSDPILMFCEYCENGDLLDFLQKKRMFMLENREETDIRKVITMEKQLMFATQVACGLEYLVSRGFIHRDIAARNIMLDHQKRCKIGDFGLARSVENGDGDYYAQGAKLPIKWMPPEAIEKSIFSSATNVWSFGVLLYEIVTLGGTPYAGWPVAELLVRLKQNERMAKPDNCNEDLYATMCTCWSEQPSKRPTFTELRKSLGELLEANTMNFHCCIILFLIRNVESFVYSCNEVYSQLMNSAFQQYATYANLYFEDGFSDWKQIEEIYLINGDDKDAYGKYPYTTGVYVSPQNGILMKIHTVSGDGKVTVYTGAGSGEEERRYLLQSWPCNSMPDWIISFDNVITIEFDSNCEYLISCFSASHEVNPDNQLDEVTIVTNPIDKDRMVILSNGRSDNSQNRKEMDLRVKSYTENREESFVDIQMQLNFDSENKGIYYKSGSNNSQLFTDYFEVQWRPKQLRPEQISDNQDNILLDIHFSYTDNDCLDGFTLVASRDQIWCYHIIWPQPPFAGFNFSEASNMCKSKGNTLPILTSNSINDAVAAFAQDLLAIGDYWIGITCNTENSTWMWQDGQSVGYMKFSGNIGSTCTGFETFALFYDDNSWTQYPADTLLGFILCATPPHESTTTGSTEYFDSTTSSHFEADPSSSNNPSPAEIITTCCFSNLGNRRDRHFRLSLFHCTYYNYTRIMALRARVVEKKIEKEKEMKLNSQPAHKSRYYGPPEIKDEWEIERKYVGIDYMNKLGEGAFGSVFLGQVLARNIPSVVGRSLVELASITNENNTVAVKTLRENADAQRRREFLAEIDLMQRIGSHERLVNILACVTSSDPILLVCEYCSDGDLLAYLRTKRSFMLENPDETDVEKVITAEKQMMFAIQIAYGLEYLSSRGFIHRDIAARNIMLNSQEQCKIGDFGLARSVGDANGNYHDQGGKLPLKWMAPEAIDRYFFSTASDMWSFGVLLFEIVTLGGSPYAGWLITELLSRLKQNERMERPDTCSEELYDLMRVCWSEHPSDRPTFSVLRQHLGELLEEVNEDDYYLKLNANANYYVLESNASD